MIVRLLAALAVMLTAVSVDPSPALARGKVYDDAPDRPSRSARWIIYLHGAYVEQNGSDQTYQYNEILQVLAAKGLHVIGEERDGDMIANDSRRVAEEVKKLLKRGVPAKQITVAGHSKGGMTALWVSTLVKNQNVKYAVLAGCGVKGHRFYRRYRQFKSKHAGKAVGKFLVMWDFNDYQAKDCDGAFSGTRIRPQNIQLPTGKGHELFNRPEASWIDPLVKFARQR